ncbi:MAG: ATP-binding protein [Thermoanaerobaculia bacterium]
MFADVMQSANLGILVFDPAHSRLVFANKDARAILESAGIAVNYAAARAAFGYGTQADEALAARPDSCRLGARLVGFRTYSNGAIEWIFFRDITEQARLEAVAEAIELTNSLGHVFAAVRHEIGNPINSAKMALSVLRRNFDQLEKGVALEYLDATLAELQRVGDLLASLKSFSLYEDVQPQPLEIDAYLAEFIGFARRDYQQHGVALTQSAGAPGVLVYADPRALRQVLMNLLANAADAMAHQADARVDFKTAVTENVVVLELVDNGPGIPTEALGHLFEPFFTTKAQGTGLGLAIARKMLARMAATIAIDSAPGRGVSVVITLRRGDT